MRSRTLRHSARQLRRHGAFLDLTQYQDAPPRIQGLFFPLNDHVGRRKDFTTSPTPAIGYGLPLVNVQEASHLFPAADSPSIIQATVSLSGSSKLRFKVYAYLMTKGTLNEGLRRISPRIVWRGELIVFRLGERVSFLRSSRGISQKNMHRVVRLFMSRVVTAMDSQEPTPTQIFE